MLASLLFLAWVHHGRRERVEHVSSLGADAAAADPASPTGWAGGRRWLIASEHNNDSYQWIMETQQMLASGEWRLRRVAYDNGIEDRAVGTPSPYRWWLATTAWLQRAVTRDSVPRSVERAALWADPLLLLLGLAAGAALLARSAGAWPAAAWLVGGTTLYPFAASFAPGAPDSHGLSLLLAAASVLGPIVAHLPAAAPRSRAREPWLAAGAVAGGLGIWINPQLQVPVLGALAIAAGISALLGAEDAGAGAWRRWGQVGAATCLLGWLAECLPDQLRWEVSGIHPAIALGWLGAAELPALASLARSGSRPLAGGAGRLRLALALGALAFLAFVLARSGLPWLHGRDVFGTRLTSLPLAAVAANLGDWFRQDGPKLQLVAVLLPLGLLAFAAGMWRRLPRTDAARTALLLATLPVIVAVVLAWWQLRGWALVGALLLGLLVAVTALLVHRGRVAAFRWWLAAAGLCLLPGALAQKPLPKARYEHALTPLEVEGIMERNLAHWLAERSATAPVILAPPFRTTALVFHGNLRALGSLNLANKPALGAAARIASATTPDEALALITKRGITHIVVPSWDGYLEEYARLFTSRPENSFVFALKNWATPPWLVPVPYQLPTVGGFENQHVFLFEVGEDVDAATALARLAEYFLEMDQGPLAASAATGLVQYPENLPALAALAQVQMASGQGARFQETLRTLLAVYRASEEHDLAWDRRVSLAVVLMQGRQPDLARREVEICLGLMDEPRLRSLTVGSLYRFQVLLRALGLRLEDPRQHELARALLPAGLRPRVP